MRHIRTYMCVCVCVCVCVSWLAVSDSLQPHRLQPTRLLCPRDSPGKNIGVGCHFRLQDTHTHTHTAFWGWGWGNGSFFLSLSLLCSMWDLTSPTRHWIHVPCVGSSESYTGPPEKSLRHLFFKPSSVLLILMAQCCIANSLLQPANVYDLTVSLSQESGHSLAGSESHDRGIQTLG